MKKIILLGLIGLMGLTSCKKQKQCKYWTMVLEDQQMKFDDATLNFTYNPSEENLTKIKIAKQNLDNSKRNKEQYCN